MEIPGQCEEGLGTGGVPGQQLSQGLQCSPCSASTTLVKPLGRGKDGVGSGKGSMWIKIPSQGRDAGSALWGAGVPLDTGSEQREGVEDACWRGGFAV